MVSCAPDPTAVAAPNKPNVGAIAGGVIGGILVVALLTFVVWKYCLKGKRRPVSESEWQDVDMTPQEKFDSDFTSHRSARASTHTVASMASSVLTRASNIIQIAYIPGVTNRSGPGSPDLLVPPLPPIPAKSPSSGFSTPYSTSDQHFFVPTFRDSIASTSTGARGSIAPSLARNSVASTMYRQNAIVSPLPAQTIVRGKAAVVSVKSTGSNTPDDSLSIHTPPVPHVDPKHAQVVKPIRIQMPGSGQGTVQSTATLGPVRALNITRKRSSDSSLPKSSDASSYATPDRTALTTPDSSRAPPPRPLTNFSTTSSDDGYTHARARKAADDSDSDSDDDDHVRARQSLLRNSVVSRDSGITEIHDTPTAMQSPFSDTLAIERPDRPAIGSRITSYEPSGGSRAPMTPIAEEFERRNSALSKRERSPFSDTHKSSL